MIRRGEPPRRRTKIKAVSPRREEKRAKRGVYGPLYMAARKEGRCWICRKRKGTTGHHVRRVGAGWGDWIWFSVDPSGTECGPWPSAHADSAASRAYPTIAVVDCERRGNIVPVCFGLGGCHDRCHEEPGFDERVDTAGLARRFGEAHADL